MTGEPAPPQVTTNLCGPSRMRDEELVARAVVDRTAFAPLYTRYVEPIYRYCYRRLGTREAAQDATTQVFVHALAALDGYRKGSFRAWLFVIAQNVVIDIVRRRRVDDPLEFADDRHDGAASPEELALLQESNMWVTTVLARLPYDQRLAVELRLAGLTGNEIQSVMRRSRGAIKMLQHRALLRLRALVNDDLKEGK